MANTRRNSEHKKGSKNHSKADGKKLSVDKNAAMADNQNSNHSAEGVLVSRGRKPVAVVVNPPNNNKGRSTRSKSKEKTPIEESIEIDPNETEMHEFAEEGELIQMEINDGGAAAEEFCSDQESQDQTESDEDESDEERAEPNDTTRERDTDDYTSEPITESEEEDPTETEPVHKRSKGRHKPDLQHQLIQDQLDAMSSSIREMKEFFMSSKMMENNLGRQDVPKRNQ